MTMDYRLRKTRRIIDNNEYRLVYKHGKYEVGRLCVIYRMPVAKEKTRIGFVTGGPMKDATYERAEKEILYLLRKSKLLV